MRPKLILLISVNVMFRLLYDWIKKFTMLNDLLMPDLNIMTFFSMMEVHPVMQLHWNFWLLLNRQKVLLPSIVKVRDDIDVWDEIRFFSFSGFGSNGYFDRRISDETLQIYSSWSYCLVENLSTWISHWPATKPSGRVMTTIRGMSLKWRISLFFLLLENKHGFGHWVMHIESKIDLDILQHSDWIHRWIQPVPIHFDILLVIITTIILMTFVRLEYISFVHLDWFVFRKRMKVKWLKVIDWMKSKLVVCNIIIIIHQLPRLGFHQRPMSHRV